MFQQRFICQVNLDEPSTNNHEVLHCRNPFTSVDPNQTPRLGGYINPSVFNSIFRSQSTLAATKVLRDGYPPRKRRRIVEEEASKMPGGVLYETPAIHEPQEWSGRMSREKEK